MKERMMFHISEKKWKENNMDNLFKLSISFFIILVIELCISIVTAFIAYMLGIERDVFFPHLFIALIYMIVALIFWIKAINRNLKEIAVIIVDQNHDIYIATYSNHLIGNVMRGSVSIGIHIKENINETAGLAIAATGFTIGAMEINKTPIKMANQSWIEEQLQAEENHLIIRKVDNIKSIKETEQYVEICYQYNKDKTSKVKLYRVYDNMDQLLLILKGGASNV